MSPPPSSHRSSSVASVTSILAALAAYFLSVEPLVLATADKHGMAAPWVEVYARPYQWLFEHTPLREPIKGYARFCWWMSQR